MIPYSCDALLYHWPIATCVIIVMNLAAFYAAATQQINAQSGWLLNYHAGLRPVEWLLSPFMHNDAWHLLLNMAFLWTFGLITEGKLGWWRFVSVYLAIAVGQSALEQAVFPYFAPDVPFTLGASAVIFGLVAMACVWAPMNEISLFMMFGFRFFTAEVSVGMLVAFYVGLDILYCILFGTGAIGSATHLMGAALGAFFGVVLLKRGVVECEDNDLLSMLSGVYGSDKRKAREAAAIAPEKLAERAASQSLEISRRFNAYLKIGKPLEALHTLQRARDLRIPWEPSRGELAELITGLQQQQHWAESAPVMAEMLARFPEGSQGVRIKLAQVCLMELSKPGRALELLAELDGVDLAPKLSALRDKIRAVAQRKVAEGVLEVDDAGW